MSRLERWSRRKRGLDDEETASAESQIEGELTRAPEAPSGEPPPAAEASPGEGEASSLDAGLPDPDTLGPDSDVTAYLQPGVSPGLKRRALRRLWQRDHYRVRDGLDDYDDDYSQLRRLAPEAGATLRRWVRAVEKPLEEVAGTEDDEAPAATGEDAPGSAETTSRDATPSDEEPPPA